MTSRSSSSVGIGGGGGGGPASDRWRRTGLSVRPASAPRRLAADFGARMVRDESAGLFVDRVGRVLLEAWVVGPADGTEGRCERDDEVEKDFGTQSSHALVAGFHFHRFSQPSLVHLMHWP